MAYLPIYNCFHPILKKKTEAIKEFDQELKDLVANMFETMYKADGIGLAANQVGISKSVIVIDTSVVKEEEYKKPPIALINPVIEFFSEDISDYSEGCLSVPTIHEDVTRPSVIQIRYFDLNMKEQILEADKLLGRVIQHEFDHLNGILFYERISAIKRTLIKSKLRKIQKGEITGTYPMILPNGTLLLNKD